MSVVTVYTVNIYNIKTKTILTKSIDDVKDKWTGNNNTAFENRFEKYIKRELKL